MLSSTAAIDFSRLFSAFDLASRRCIIAAVSGGSDSTALLLALKDHLDRFAPATRLVAATVDHALRPDSAGEARDVARLCAKLSVEHITLQWFGRKPATGLPAAAREARYDLLAAIAAARGTDLVLTGHTADDQAETVLMRSQRDTGRGLAGMAPATLFDGKVWIIRPLLTVRREQLRAFLSQRGMSWIDDPTNRDDAYERPRLRASLDGEAGGRKLEEALATAASAAVRREALGSRAAELIEAHARHAAPGLVRLDPAFFRADPDPALYALRILLATTGGTPHLPDEGRSAALLARLKVGGRVRGVLSRTLLDQRKDGLFLLREARGLPQPASFAEDAIWDGRFRLRGVAEAGPVMPYGIQAASSGTSSQGDAPDSLVRAAEAGLPAILHEGQLRLMSHELQAVPSAIPQVAPWARFLPSFDLLPAEAAAALVGAPAHRPPPWQEHNRRKA